MGRKRTDATFVQHQVLGFEFAFLLFLPLCAASISCKEAEV
jgi:hypothetical protein